MRRLVVLLAALLAAGCEERKPLSDSTTDNQDYNVQLLFSHDGCRMYRFEDGGLFRYFVRCASTQRTEFEDVETNYNAATKTTITTVHPLAIETVTP